MCREVALGDGLSGEALSPEKPAHEITDFRGLVLQGKLRGVQHS